MIYFFIILNLILVGIIAFLINKFYFSKIEKFSNKICYGNDFCDNQDLCMSQRCIKCGLRAPCNKDSDCGPNRCDNGCCDNM